MSRPQERRVPGSKRETTEDPLCMGPVARYIIRSGQTSFRWYGGNFEEGVPAQLSFSTFDGGSKLRDVSGSPMTPNNHCFQTQSATVDYCSNPTDSRVVEDKWGLV
ncbi:hypothetical protein AVEN_4954-1 [Araneus ventricosus]|uniref:Uncharacterized protein n=1 Tax=Araneus ventricosus TaxID=182803 RepID=A0A4Y2E4Y1_ARAVE|nr:hypothetical protein AVEN_4954-1 [Araneus ventricosus]